MRTRRSSVGSGRPTCVDDSKGIEETTTGATRLGSMGSATTTDEQEKEKHAVTVRRAALAAATALLALTTGCSAGGPGSTPPPTTTNPTVSRSAASARSARSAALPQLPRGGRTLLPRYRLVGYAGSPGSPALGRLDVGKLEDRTGELVRLSRAYAAGRLPMPVLELIATVVQSRPGRDGMYRTRVSDAVIAEHLAAARKIKGLLLLDIQPGRATFLDEVKAYSRWLAQPDVGLALDPEWAMGPGQVPMRVFGHATGRDIDAVSAYVAGIVRAQRLPEKALVFHQLAPAIVTGEGQIRRRPGVVVIKSVDGIGTRAMKTETWTRLTRRMPGTMQAGFKLFFDEDRRQGPLMTPAQVLALRPQPAYVLYE